MNVKQNLEQINEHITNSLEKVHRDTRPNVIAVTKYVTIERAKEAYDAGIRHFGENRLEGFQAKREALPDDVVMHFIGTLQSRKVKEVIDDIDYLHALDRKSLAKEINKRASHVVKCFVQVNVSEEESKHGLALEEVDAFIELLEQYENIQVVGLMTMAPYTEDEAEIRQIFETLRNKRDEIQAKQLDYAPCTELSMGMSNDYEIAAEEGATFVRIGTKLVGKEE
ncbi:YggS family pyridoxal phosphate-dependent enzyme [Staphylococcus simulans]|uniref:YggS family pyridoxal phosphate-dependent enzyme n=1 Tax=Staphylococcus simulans TaxID=1286 RepID=UPI000D1D6FA7|nr:YggS family pyridoxal phosphate-dependent enzyme [Staphylococcus simulans]MDY5060005.1 YggS family pyridoxal phosphate-dependent enzyme [Staphylococcus simulans]PTJ15860.1 YggS family pyridoxal phosphate-dependent enzyme [Staphylococcus simulans]RIN75738.1 YggS family pyridoxal phosphate-dependent enzyme [Staphylococcus simulans]